MLMTFICNDAKMNIIDLFLCSCIKISVRYSPRNEMTIKKVHFKFDRQCQVYFQNVVPVVPIYSPNDRGEN